MKGRPLHQRLGFAAAGLRTGWSREASLRSHVMFAAGAVLLLVVTGAGPVWWAIVSLVIGAIIALELLNSAIEGTIDLLHPDIHPEIKSVKDMVAGAVLVMSIAAVAIAAALLVDRWPALWARWQAWL